MAKPWLEVQAIIIAKATRDEQYRRRLLEDPVRVTEEERGEELPGTVRIRVIEADPRTGYILLPPRPVTDEAEDAALRTEPAAVVRRR